ncbi:SRPBCC domain-containing protein [Bacillus sp. ISL-40]|uniref:SRPBCC family protein n=1 Tax=unclassified Bacillus (in: firmicutes) TaxID=185979 RepID=UPI001BECD07A|nr:MULTISPECIES: SRPBCC domain-containing protein [unclassified Bacillus (in: firmicutes)]MBT2697393.1 SRPBCC domain-containing protein [Bacillus sp. ISL-40]MBT2723893.1 SRPBCC domain-containing protein [Bacillus sp. ISL-46]MBT2741791.1 SRPBCC domain-containing protein [Bacillus sp. ISL-77]
MGKLFVDQTIEINAPASKVWDVLTVSEYNNRWATEFSSGGPQFQLESTWELGSPVLWKGEDGTVIVEGNVTALEKNKLLRFTVFDVRSEEKALVTEEDGITFQLSEDNGKTTLHILQGDFSVMLEGKKYRDLSAEIWDKVLPMVKEMAESTN